MISHDLQQYRGYEKSSLCPLFHCRVWRLLITIFTEARLCIVATTKLLGTPISVDKTGYDLSSHLLSSHALCKKHQPANLLLNPPITCGVPQHNYHSLTYMSCSNTTDKCLPAISCFIKAISSSRIKGTSYLRWVELDKYPWPSSKSLNLSILLSGTPAFSITATTFTQ